MGEAKKRGTFEQRKALAIAKREEERKGQLPLRLPSEERRRRHEARMLLASMAGIIATVPNLN